MAILLPNKTTCALCGGSVSSEKEAMSFPAFIPPGYELSAYSDSIFHRACFERWEHHEELQYLYDRYREIWETRPRDLKTLQEMEAWGKEAFGDLFARRTSA